ncbi:MAG: ABC transporter substrate-binding protein [Proteobacteria bacterium]|nr:ABC transporter substrate-binding protein [Pseudomonadota bacterium]
MNWKLLSLAASLGLGALTASPHAGLAQTRGGDVVIAMVGAPPSLDAQVTSAQVARNVTLELYETLYGRDENGNAVPDLAEGVDISADGKTYLFKLRKGVKFHNGKEMTSVDVVASLERYRKVGASLSLVDAIEAVEIKGPYEVAIKLKSVQAVFLDNLSSPRAPIAIYPAEEAAKDANKINYIGTGPFKFVEYRPDSHVKLERFKDYVPNPAYAKRDGLVGRKEVFIDTVTFRFMPEAGARVAALESGDVHVVETVDGPTAKRLEGNRNFKVFRVLPFAFQVLKFNHALAPTDDLNFRKAVAAALDDEEVMAIAHPDIYQLDGGWLFPNAAFHTDAGRAYNENNLKKAKELVGQSKYKGEKITFIVDNLRSNVDVATVVQQKLAEIGVKVDISVADWPTVSKVGFTPTGWNFWTHGFGIEPFEGPASVMAPWVAGLSQQKVDAEVDRLYAVLNTEMDATKRKAVFAEFQKRMYDAAVALKIGNYGLFQVATTKLKNFEPHRIPRMWGVTLEK